MSASFAHPPFMPCPACGASVAVETGAEHVCDPERRLDFELFQHRGELAALETEIQAFMGSPRGRFEQWYAERERRPDGQRRPDGPSEPDAADGARGG
jgi:hypothetical protein